MAKLKYSADEIEAIARTAMQHAIGAPDSDVGQARQRNLEYYNAEAKGDLSAPEVSDRSDFVATDVADTVEAMLPEFMDMFISGDAVEVEARHPKDQQGAEMVKAWLNYLFLTRLDGVEITHDWFKDALIQKVGFLKVWIEEEADDAKQKYEGQTEEQLVMLMQDGWQLVGQPEQDDDGNLNFVVNKESRTKQIKVCVIAPHEMRVDGNARWDAEPAMIGQIFYKRRFELEQDGLEVEEYAAAMSNMGDSEAIEMLGDVDDSMGSSPHKTHDLIKVSEVYIKLDADGDGIAEWMKITLVNDKLAEYKDGSEAFEQVDDHPYVWVCPIPRPHSFYGDCPADFAIQPQKLRTHTIRAIQDGMFLSVNPRTYINTMADVNVADVLESRPGGVIRGKGSALEAIGQITIPNLGAPAYQFNEWLETWKENRTGFTRYSSGLDSNSLNKTATGISIVTQKSGLRQKLMARFFAVGYAKLMKKMLKLSITYQNQEEMIKIGGEFVTINPSHFTTDYNFKITTGLGQGTKEQQVGRMSMILQTMMPGVQMGVVTPENYANALMELLKANEIQNPEAYVTPNPQPQGPNPEQIQQGMQQLQQQGQQIQEMGGEIQRLEQENVQLKQANANKDGDLQIKAQSSQVEAQFKAQELALRERELALKEQEAQIKAQLEFSKMELDRATAMHPIEQEVRETEKDASESQAIIAGLQAVIEQMQAPKTKIGRMVRLPDGSYQMEQQEV